MIGRATLKKTFKRTTGWATVLSQPMTSVLSSNAACIFYFHRVANLRFNDSQLDDWNITPRHFEQQIRALTNCAEILPLPDLPARLHKPQTSSKPLVCLTFDDGYANFHSEVLPILKRYGVPATTFVVTSVIGSVEPMPFDHWARKNSARSNGDAWRALNWKELEDCVASGLVTIGAHSHQHLRGSQCSRQELLEEASKSREILRHRLGDEHSSLYAYPYGNTRLRDVSQDYVDAVKGAGYELAVTTDTGLADKHSDLFLLPRLEAHITDTPMVLKAKAHGSIAPLKLTDHFRGIYRA